MKDVMIDFETFGNGSKKCVCQVGAVYFDNVTGELGAEFFANIDAESHVRHGAKIDASTVYWWLQQSDEARKSLQGELQDVVVAFTALNEFLSKATRIWSHATFDFVTLMETMKDLGIKPSFSYRAGLDLRTLTYLSGVNVKSTHREGVHHNGLDDAKHQVKYAVAAMNQIKTNKKLIQAVEKIIS